MMISRLSRMVVMLAALAFGAIAIGMWVAPEGAAHRLGLSAASGSGRATLRADLGGVFAGMAVLCAAAAWSLRRTWRIAAAVVLAMIAAGRLIECIASGGATLDASALSVELGVVAAIAGLRPSRPARSRRRSPQASGLRRDLLRRLGFGTIVSPRASIATRDAILLARPAGVFMLLVRKASAKRFRRPRV